MFGFLEFLVITFIALGIFHFLKSSKKANPPPGPKGIPVFGNLFQFGSNGMDTLKQWSKEYGPIVQLNICGQKMILLNDSATVKEMFNEGAFIGKPMHAILMSFSKGPWGIISTEGETWQAHRRFTLRGLRDFGFSKSSIMETLISEEIEETLDYFKEFNGKTLDVGKRFNISVSNSLWTIVSGERNDQEDSNISDIMHDFLRALNVLFQRGAFVFPWFRHIAPELCGFNDLMRNIDQLHNFIMRSFNNHVDEFIEGSPRDFTDLYLEEISRAKPGSPFYREIGERHMIATITDLFLAGNETTSVTLTWAILYLSVQPKQQERLWREIEKVVGTGRTPLLGDRPKMPFTEAVMQESLRLSTLLPFGVPHRAVKDHTFRGYTVEKDTVILAHLSYIHNDKTIWGDPDVFRPDRFLDEQSLKIKSSRTEHLIPFQAGRRQCPGESLARDTLFLFLTSIFQRFEILPDPEHPKPDLSPVLGFVNSPKPFKVLLKLRGQ